MAIDYPAILSQGERDRRFRYTEQHAMLYAVAIGMGSDSPLARDSGYARELPFVWERDLRAVPTFATVVAWGSGIPVAQLGLDPRGILHGEEETIFHGILPPTGEVVADSGIAEIYDRGPDKGALVIRETHLRNAATDEPIATLRRSLFARRNGGQGGKATEAPRPHIVPDRPPQMVLRYQTSNNQALVYRLCGDRTTLHVDPEAAAIAGFDRPILHGLCTYGICCRAVLEAYCEFDPARLASHAVRFSSPVFPGDTLEVRLWRDEAIVSFEAIVRERGVTVIKNGKAVLR